MKTKTITICCSANFFKESTEIEKELKKLGFKVKLPSTAYKMKKTKNFDVSKHKLWRTNPQYYNIKSRLIRGHFKKVIECDAILVLNHEKNGIKGYIGPNTLMEMAIAFHNKKPIYIFNQITETALYKEEIYGMGSIIINEDLTKILV